MAAWPYNTPQWKRLRLRILIRDRYTCQWPGCNALLRTGRNHPRSAVVDHKVRVKEAPEKAFDPDNLWSLCRDHHYGVKQQEDIRDMGPAEKAKRLETRHRISDEMRGYSTAIGPDGWPIDNAHPFHDGKQATNTRQQWGGTMPTRLQPSNVHVHLVCGPPASGKSTYVQANAQPHDMVIDFDEIRQRIGGAKWDTDHTITGQALKYRDRMLRDLAHRVHGEAWLIVTAPTQAERDIWAETLGNVTVHVMDTPAEECIRRIRDEPRRQATSARQIAAVRAWFDVANRAKATKPANSPVHGRLILP